MSTTTEGVDPAVAAASTVTKDPADPSAEGKPPKASKASTRRKAEMTEAERRAFEKSDAKARATGKPAAEAIKDGKPKRAGKRASTSSPTRRLSKAEKAKAATARKGEARGAARAPSGTNGAKGLSIVEAIHKVLREAKQADMNAKEVTAEIQRRKLAPGLQGKTPDATVGSRLAVLAKEGRYFERTGPGRFKALEEGPTR